MTEILTTVVVSNGHSLLKRIYVTTRYIICPLYKGVIVITKKPLTLITPAFGADVFMVVSHSGIKTLFRVRLFPGFLVAQILLAKFLT